MENKNSGKNDKGIPKTATKYAKKEAPNQKSAQKGNNRKFKQKRIGMPMPKFDDTVRLNKYLSNAGICSRREADTLIQTGVVSVNGKIITEMGFKVGPNDEVRYDGAQLHLEKKHYILLNKPKDFTLRADSTTKKTAYQLVKKACKEYLYPIGKLDSEACGLVVFTNDQDLIKKLTHPKTKISQLFHVTLEQQISEDHLQQLVKGLYVDDKMFSAKEANFVKGKNNYEIGVRIRSGNAKLVKLMLGKLGYKIVKLDRVEYAGLTKLDLSRGNYRTLSSKEIGFLQMA